MSTYQTSTDAVLSLHEIRSDSAAPNSPAGVLGNPQVNNRQELLVSQSLPPRAELVRMGNSWSTRLLTDVAGVLTLPTTAAQHVFHNGEAAGGKSYIVEQINFDIAVAPTDVDGNAGIIFQLSRGAVATVSAAQAVIVNSLSGKGAYGGLAAFDDANTIVDSGWTNLRSISNMGFGAQWVAHSMIFADFEPGLIIIPPGGTLAVGLFSIDTNMTGRPSFIWHEVQIPINS